jgi:4-hydroxy-4-methyl-2-oxoglutarate aldolase
MRTGKDRVQVAEVGGSVTCSTAQVSPANLVLADGDGVVIVPRSRAEEVIDLAEGISAREAQFRAVVLDGVEFGRARSQHGYFGLQRGGR